MIVNVKVSGFDYKGFLRNAFMISLMMFFALNIALCFLLLISASKLSHAATGEAKDEKARQFLMRAMEFCGGENKFQSLKTVKKTEKLRMLMNQGDVNVNVPMNLKTYLKFPELLRVETDLSGGVITQIINGNKGMVILPNGKQSITSTIIKDSKAALWGELYYLFSRIHTPDLSYDYVGQKNKYDQLFEVVKINPKNLPSIELYLEAKTMEPVLVIHEELDLVADESSPSLLMEIFSEYKKVDGVNLPHLTTFIIDEQKYAEFELLDIQFNIDLDESLFDVDIESDSQFDRTKIPPRTPDTPPNLIDLTEYYNARLDETWIPKTPFPEHLRSMANSLIDLPTGVQKLDGIEFDIRGIIQIGGLQLNHIGGYFPEKIEGISINKKCKTIHVLHSTTTALQVEDGTLIGKYILHYADGSQKELEIKCGDDVRDWWNMPNMPMETNNSTVAWRGSSELSRKLGIPIQLYHNAWQNPLPNMEIKTIDYVSTMTNAAPFLIAITLE